MIREVVLLERVNRKLYPVARKLRGGMNTAFFATRATRQGKRKQ